MGNLHEFDIDNKGNAERIWKEIEAQNRSYPLDPIDTSKQIKIDDLINDTSPVNCQLTGHGDREKSDQNESSKLANNFKDDDLSVQVDAADDACRRQELREDGKRPSKGRFVPKAGDLLEESRARQFALSNPPQTSLSSLSCSAQLPQHRYPSLNANLQRSKMQSKSTEKESTEAFPPSQSTLTPEGQRLAEEAGNILRIRSNPVIQSLPLEKFATGKSEINRWASYCPSQLKTGHEPSSGSTMSGSNTQEHVVTEDLHQPLLQAFKTGLAKLKPENQISGQQRPSYLDAELNSLSMYANNKLRMQHMMRPPSHPRDAQIANPSDGALPHQESNAVKQTVESLVDGLQLFASEVRNQAMQLQNLQQTTGVKPEVVANSLVNVYSTAGQFIKAVSNTCQDASQIALQAAEVTRSSTISTVEKEVLESAAKLYRGITNRADSWSNQFLPNPSITLKGPRVQSIDVPDQQFGILHSHLQQATERVKGHSDKRQPEYKADQDSLERGLTKNEANFGDNCDKGGDKNILAVAPNPHSEAVSRTTAREARIAEGISQLPQNGALNDKEWKCDVCSRRIWGRAEMRAHQTSVHRRSTVIYVPVGDPAPQSHEIASTLPPFEDHKPAFQFPHASSPAPKSSFVSPHGRSWKLDGEVSSAWSPGYSRNCRSRSRSPVQRQPINISPVSRASGAESMSRPVSMISEADSSHIHKPKQPVSLAGLKDADLFTSHESALAEASSVSCEFQPRTSSNGNESRSFIPYESKEPIRHWPSYDEICRSATVERGAQSWADGPNNGGIRPSSVYNPSTLRHASSMSTLRPHNANGGTLSQPFPANQADEFEARQQMRECRNEFEKQQRKRLDALSQKLRKFRKQELAGSHDDRNGEKYLSSSSAAARFPTLEQFEGSSQSSTPRFPPLPSMEPLIPTRLQAREANETLVEIPTKMRWTSKFEDTASTNGPPSSVLQVSTESSGDFFKRMTGLDNSPAKSGPQHPLRRAATSARLVKPFDPVADAAKLHQTQVQDGIRRTSTIAGGSRDNKTAGSRRPYSEYFTGQGRVEWDTFVRGSKAQKARAGSPPPTRLEKRNSDTPLSVALTSQEEVANGSSGQSVSHEASMEFKEGQNCRIDAGESSATVAAPIKAINNVRTVEEIDPAVLAAINTQPWVVRRHTAGPSPLTAIVPDHNRGDSAVNKCVQDLKALGFCLDKNDGEDVDRMERLNIYAEATEGSLEGAIDMINEERKVWDAGVAARKAGDIEIDAEDEFGDNDLYN